MSGEGESGLKKTETFMNIMKMFLLFLFLGAVAFGIYYLVKHGGKCLSPANWISCIIGGGSSVLGSGTGALASTACQVPGVSLMPLCSLTGATGGGGSGGQTDSSSLVPGLPSTNPLGGGGALLSGLTKF